jgi:dTDP-L-rhamnose 4-epimerase
MARNILITGGAGFIGSHLADELISKGYNVRVFDNLSEQVHGPAVSRPQYLNKEAELVVGDIRDPVALKEALRGMDAIFHFAAMVGVGQSMYEIKNYTEVNNIGTANLLELLIDNPVEKLITASSMSIYGEGLYRDSEGNIKQGVERNNTRFRNKDWEVYDSEGNKLIPLPTPEDKTPNLTSIYALSKYDQERMTMITGRAYNIPTIGLRFFNVYGTRQALSNPYTGVLAIFASRLLNNNRPIIFEDGLQKRDFINVKDVIRACRLALEIPEADGKVINIGSGNSYTILEIAEKMAAMLDKEILGPEILGKYRVGDIRHCFADISEAKNILGFIPGISLEEGLQELSEWLKMQKADDKVIQASEQLISRGLTV